MYRSARARNKCQGVAAAVVAMTRIQEQTSPRTAIASAAASG